jgi:hypothetical protein
VRCTAITSAGERCRLDATSGSYCWSHAPENAAERKAKARRGGKARGASEMSEVKREIRRVIEAVDSGETERGVGAVLFQGFNTLLKAVETERRIAEQAEVLERIRALEAQERQQRGGYGTWGR